MLKGYPAVLGKYDNREGVVDKMDTSKIWLIADSHFFHKNIIKYCNRPFCSTLEMNEVLIKNWNSVVKNSDRVFMLGDFCLAGKDQIIEVGRQLNGRKTLILGNHDHASLKTYYEAGFEMVSKYPILIEDKFLLSHHPRQVGADLYLIYGHIHDNPLEQKIDNSFCVSVERINYTPISLDEIKKNFKF